MSLKAERERKPVDKVWDALRESGIFYHFVPRKYGGKEFDIDTFIDAVLPLSAGCASTGWVTSFCMEHNWMMAQFPEQAQDEIFSEFPYIIAPGVISPGGSVEKVDGGYILNGRWKWGTGVMHADWILASGLLDNGTDVPDAIFCVLPVEQCQVIDTWYVDGMIATGSNDIAVENVFIPDHRTLPVGDMRQGNAWGAKLYDSPLFGMPMLPFLALTAAIPAVGAAQAAVEYYRDRAKERVVYGTTGAQQESQVAQIKLGHAANDVEMAEALLRHAGREIYELGKTPDQTTMEDRIRLRLIVAKVVDMCRQTITNLCTASGASVHMLDNPLQRHLRDVNVMCGHVVFQLDGAAEMHGRLQLGLEPSSTLI